MDWVSGLFVKKFLFELLQLKSQIDGIGAGVKKKIPMTGLILLDNEELGGKFYQTLWDYQNIHSKSEVSAVLFAEFAETAIFCPM